MRSWFQPISPAFRALRRRPGATLLSLAVLALGVGAATALFSLYDQLVLKPLPMAGQERLVTLAFKTVVKGDQGQTGLEEPLTLTLPDVRELQSLAGPFETVALEAGRMVRADTAGNTRSVFAVVCSPNYFQALGIKLDQGLAFAPGDPAPGVVVSHAFWRNALGGGAIPGAQVRVAGVALPILGVAPRGFAGLLPGGVEPALWVSLDSLDLWSPGELAGLRERIDGNDDLVSRAFTPVARLKPGITPTQGAAALGPLLAFWRESFPKTRHGLQVQVEPLVVARKKEWRGFLPQAAGLSMAVGLLLFLGCLNVANLQLARWMDRRREQATRQALGASSLRLIGEQIAELVLLLGTGVLLALPVAMLLAESLGKLVPPSLVARQLHPSLDWRVLGFALGVLFSLGLVLAAFAAWTVLQDRPGAALRGGQGDLGGLARWRKAILAVQLALSLALMGTTWGVVQGLRQATTAPIGYQPKGVLSCSFSMPPDWDKARVVQALADLQQRVRGLAGVEAASVVLAAPMDPVRITFRMQTPEGALWHVYGNTVQPGCFQVLGVPLVAGRDFTDSDRFGAPPVAILNQSMARMLWPGQSAVGRRYGNGVEVVGVVADFRQMNVYSDSGPTLFRPIAQSHMGMQSLVVKTSVAAGRLIPQLEAEIARMDSRIPTLQMEPLQAKLDRQLQPRRLAGFLLSLLSGLTGLLAVSGVFGLQSCLAAQQRREAGLRMALGASPRGLLLHFIAGVAWPAGLGLGAGILLVYLSRPTLEALLGGLGAPDLKGLLGTALVLLVSACLAALPPLVGVVLQNPTDALRNE